MTTQELYTDDLRKRLNKTLQRVRELRSEISHQYFEGSTEPSIKDILNRLDHILKEKE